MCSSSKLIFNEKHLWPLTNQPAEDENDDKRQDSTSKFILEVNRLTIP